MSIRTLKCILIEDRIILFPKYLGVILSSDYYSVTVVTSFITV